jgi:hypothetical protein
MSCTAKHGIHGIAEGALEPIACELTVALHMPDGPFDDGAGLLE